jgi:hypothetical protein
VADIAAAHMISAGLLELDAFTSDGEALLSGVIDSIAAEDIVADLVEAEEIEFAVSEEIREIIESGFMEVVFDDLSSPYALNIHALHVVDMQTEMDLIMGQADAWATAQMESFSGWGVAATGGKIVHVGMQIMLEKEKQETERQKQKTNRDGWDRYNQNTDSDGDGISNANEIAAGTNQFKSDSDGDGVPDGDDAAPLDPDTQCFPPPWLNVMDQEPIVYLVNDIEFDHVTVMFDLVGSYQPHNVPWMIAY